MWYGRRVWVLAPEKIRFQPDAANWRIHFALLARGRCRPVVLRSVRVAGVEVTRSVESEPLLPVSRLRGISGREPGGGVEIVLSTGRLPFRVVDGRDYPLTVELVQGRRVMTFTVTVAVRALPRDPRWVPADLHMHTEFSDGSKTPAELKDCLKDWGYRVAYVTDHADQILARAGSWEHYAQTISGQTSRSIALYPGAEVTLGSRAGRKFSPHGDMLAYGISSLSGLENRRHPSQCGVDAVLKNNPRAPSSPGIAHPTRYPQWVDWRVQGCRGVELLSGVQANCSETAFPVMRWRSELKRRLEATFAHGFFLSARASSDWHGRGEFPGFVTWLRTGGRVDKSSVDMALYRGRTVASQRGGLAYPTLKCLGLACQVGDIVKGLPAGLRVWTKVTFKPVASGQYTLELWEDDKARSILVRSGTFSAGQSYVLRGSFIFPGGRHYYHLYVHGADHIYSSPIFLGS